MQTLRIALLCALLLCCIPCRAVVAGPSGTALSEAEQHIVEQLGKGRGADLQKQFQAREDREITASFLRELMIDPPAAIDAAEEGLGVRYAVVHGVLDLSGTEVSYPLSLMGCEFRDGVIFMEARFSKGVDFRLTEFSGGADFQVARFSGGADFWQAKFSEGAFIYAEFSEANFREAEFTEGNFWGAGFSEKADFEAAKFSEGNFRQARFSEVSFRDAAFAEASFEEAKFLDSADFQAASFSAGVDFRSAEFSKTNFRGVGFSETDFTVAKFAEAADFSTTRFSGDAIFEGVKGTQNIMVAWEGGLKGKLAYDEAFYIALIENYQSRGWFLEADDAHYAYRVEKRKRRETDPSPKERWKGKMELVFLEIPFGYGVKPLNLLYTYTSLLLFFSIMYLFFTQRTPSCPFSLRRRWREFRLYMGQHWWKLWKHVLQLIVLTVNSRFAWSLIHSIDNLTPGIDFRSMDTIGPGVTIRGDSRALSYLHRIQQAIGWYLLILLLALFSKTAIR